MSFFHSLLRSLLHWYWWIWRPVTVGVKVLLINSDSEVLLVRLTYTSGWHLPGGGVERGERLVDAALRELEEETKVIATAEACKLLGTYSNFSQGKSDHVTVYIVRDFEYHGPIEANFEIEESRFFALDALPADVSPGTRKRIVEYLTGGQTSFNW